MGWTSEQTVNADSASRLTGIASFSKSARRRMWIVTRFFLSELVSHLIESQGRQKCRCSTRADTKTN